MYQHSNGRFCILPEWLFKEQKQWPEGILQKKLFLKISEFKGKYLCQSLLLKLQNILKKRLWHRSFSVNFTKLLRNVLEKLCFVKPLQRFASEIAKLKATSSLFLKEAVLFNYLSIKSNKTWYFLIHPPLISFKMMLAKHIFYDHPLPERKPNRGSWRYGISKGIEKSKQKFQNQLKKKWIF